LRQDRLLLLELAASALFWWPIAMEPNLGLPWWSPLICVGALTAIATALSDHWLRHVLASVSGTFAGLCSGYAIWAPSDEFAPLVLLILTGAALLVSLVAGLVARYLLAIALEHKSGLWVALACCAACGPIALALTPPLVSSRVARNDRVAARRFAALKNAVEITWAAGSNRSGICDGQTLKRHYDGPPLSERDWQRIVGNYVKADGYVFGIYCHEQGGYTIDAWPESEKGSGTRRFCTDESGRIGCGATWNRSRYACTPCS